MIRTTTQRHRRWWLLRFLTGMLLAVLLLTASPLGAPRAYAQFGGGDIVFDPGNYAENAASFIANNASALATGALITKEMMDAIAWKLAKLMLQQVQRETIRWINSGFEGSPAFVRDLDGFLEQSLDNIAGELIYGSDLAFLCSPFELDIRIMLEFQYKTPTVEKVQCTLSDVITNVDGFLEGDFFSGGIPGWFELTQKPSNNFFGAYGEAAVALQGELESERVNVLEKLGWSGGFKSTEECVLVEDGGEECLITMPGKTIADHLTFTISENERTLIAADEINEIISALLAQLAQQAFKGTGNLLGLTRTGGSYGSVSYLNRAGNPAYDNTPGVVDTDTVYSPIGEALSSEQKFADLYDDIISRAEGIESLINELENPPDTNPNDDQEPKSCNVPTYVKARTREIRVDASLKRNEVEQNVVILEDLQARYEAAKSDTPDSIESSEEQQAILAELSKLHTDGTLHTAADLPREKLRLRSVDQELDSLMQQIQNACGGENSA